ncbi:stage V sporulation protein AB [Salsuginibacillus halophilus]|uniref:Stage V sporulation protein AB n=1 Tax=Salsuginibacillus halophilus TaxID=517424 RepID=A0A2P8HAP5_9BACI|nr:stage V sporulation protein AB [Salsuginibacillus halophilus]PSL43305.1 stage V sporulation protein AB [Salsuginibacillus halophilus]
MEKVITLEALATVLLGLGGGLAVGSGLVAFISALGIIPRLVQIAKCYSRLVHLEWAVISGVLFGSIMTLTDAHLALPEVVAVIPGFFAGMFVGMLAAALTEVLNVMPVLAKRLGVDQGIFAFLFAIALGKVLGSLFFWFVYVTL